MNDKVKLKCTIGTETVISPLLVLYTCNAGLYTSAVNLPNIKLDQYAVGDFNFNIDSYIT